MMNWILKRVLGYGRVALAEVLGKVIYSLETGEPVEARVIGILRQIERRLL